jgi:glycosyltransferase involved in cell wall biosynthesis
MAAVRAHAPDVVHAHDLDTLDTGAALAASLGVPLVYDSHELWRANNFILKMPAGVQRRWRRMEETHIRDAAAVIITTESRAARVREWYPGVDPVVVMNCQDGDPTPRTRVLQERLGLADERRILLYQGLIHQDRGVFVALDALRRLDDRFVFVAVGGGSDAPRLGRAVVERRLQDRAYVLPEVPHAELAPITASAHYGLSLIQNTSESYYLSAPNKLFEYMRAGIPVVASDFPEVRAILDRGDVGDAIDPADAGALVGAVEALEADPLRRDRIANTAARLLGEQYNWQIQSRRLLDLYDRIAADLVLR